VKRISPDALLDTYHAERHPAGYRALRHTMAQTAIMRPDSHVDALRDAVAAARAKADALAAASGAHLGGVTRVVEQRQDVVEPQMFSALQERAATPVEPGTQEVQATVTVTFALP
jgi:uncharacterized protein YggE